MSTLKDIHEFDGTYKINLKVKITEKDKTIFFNWLKISLKFHLNTESQGLNLIINDSQTFNNYDNITCVYADDILAEICFILIKTKVEDRIDIFKNIVEQMDDMYNLGQCPQGRVTRLYQIYNTLI